MQTGLFTSTSANTFRAQWFFHVFEFRLILLLRKWNKPHRLFTFSKISTQEVWTSRFWSGLKSVWLPAASHRAESDGVSHHGHQGLRSSDGGVQQLVVRQEAVVQVFSGVLHQLLLPLDGRLLVFAGVTGANGAQEQHPELLTYRQEQIRVFNMLPIVSAFLKHLFVHRK